jgi:hypothetical protein
VPELREFHPSDQDLCPQCAAPEEDDNKPHYAALVRLWQFARPRATVIGLGLALTLARHGGPVVTSASDGSARGQGADSFLASDCRPDF